MATKPMFPAHAKSAFLKRTRQAYSDMRRRLGKKNMVTPFPLECFRAHVLDNCLGGEYSGAAQCPHCLRVLDISDVVFDHANPLVRGGSAGLENIVGICASCNAAKGSMTAPEFNALLSFLEREVPYARTAVLKRLQEHSKLLAGKRRGEMLLRKQGFTKRKTKPPLVAAIEQVF